MAKTMAVIDDNNIVTNIISCNDDRQSEEKLVDVFDFLVAMGDEYINGQFFRNGKQVQTLSNIIDDMQDALSILGIE